MEKIAALLAAQLLALYVTSKEGPFGLLQLLRLKLGVIQQQISEEVLSCKDAESGTEEWVKYTYLADLPSRLQPTNLARGITCTWCMAIFAVIIVLVVQHYAPIVVEAMALAMGVIWITTLMNKWGSE